MPCLPRDVDRRPPVQHLSHQLHHRLVRQLPSCPHLQPSGSEAANISAMQQLTSPANSGSNGSHQLWCRSPGAVRLHSSASIAVLRASGFPSEEAIATTRKEAVRKRQSWPMARRQLMLAAAAGIAGAWRQGWALAADEVKDVPEFGSGSREVDKDAGFSFRLPRTERPKKRSSGGGTRSRSLQPEEEDDDDDDEEEEILVLEGVTAPIGQNTSFDVYINLADGDPSKTAPQYVGTYYNVPHMSPGGGRQTSGNMRVGIGGALKRLGITDLDNLVVSLVPRGARPEDVPVVVKGVRIEFE